MHSLLNPTIRTFGLLPLALAIFGFAGSPAYALVSSPGSVGAGEWGAEAGTVLERGKVEPNENLSSHQPARINILRASISRGIAGPDFGTDHFIRADLKYIDSGREEAGQLFYDRDRGAAATLTYGFNLLHEENFLAGAYASVSPYIGLNKDKFSLPRVDLFALGLKAGLRAGPSWLIDSSIHFGSGIPSHQNPYIALTQTLGYELSSRLGLPVTVRLGPYAEFDLKDRYDTRYDAAFSPAGRRDRIRSAKFGVLASADISFTQNYFSTVTYVQKLGGYDAPATNALALSIGAKL